MSVWQVTLGLLLLAWPVLSCWPAYVQEAVEQSDVVLTAKVLHLGKRRGRGMNRVYNLVRLEVKSLMKGEDVFSDQVRNTLIGNHHEATFLEHPDTSTLDLSSSLTFGVDGVSATGTCSGRVRVRDVQLFFLKVKTRGELRKGHHEAVFKVASQPIKVTLEKLRMVEAAATKGECTYSLVLTSFLLYTTSL